MAIESYTSNPGNRIYLVRVGDKTRRCGTEDEARYWERVYQEQERKAMRYVSEYIAFNKGGHETFQWSVRQNPRCWASIRYCFVLPGGSVAKLSATLPRDYLRERMAENMVHWVEY